jgi:hypothetical protein
VLDGTSHPLLDWAFSSADDGIPRRATRARILDTLVPV